MMKLLLINSVIGFGSTGRIVLDIANDYDKSGYEVKIAYGRTYKVSKSMEADIKKYGFRIGNDFDVYSHVMYTRLTDRHALASKYFTKRFIRWAERYNPDILWLHNIHGYYINFELLFQWIKARPNMQVKWTLHDCWSFTGHCSHFTYVKCNKWKSECDCCPQLDQYPMSKVDDSKSNYLRKKEAFTGVNNMVLVTPSNWLKDLVKESFLSEYPTEVVYNKVDTNVFKPTVSTFKMDYGIQHKKMILAVANVWEQRKGLEDIIKLSKMLDVDKYSVVVVGLSDMQIETIQKMGIKNLIPVPRTDSANQLAKVYTAADVFVNPSYEETFGLTTAEAQACGTYTLVYKGTACEEILDKHNGSAVKDIDEMCSLIKEVADV